MIARLHVDGLFHLEKDGRMSRRGWAPSNTYDVRLLDMLIALLNGRDDTFAFTAEELEIARAAGMNEETLRQELRREAFSLYIKSLV
ncbi:hypothetical protein ACIBG8_24590 [Nonomuraea sp. NPDC050556]|uniref:hypothetical protein n=1 Tax=Nonomuraea sp. NPDC050556 TaxID=3364369 RepID=UPI003789482E